MPGDAIEITAGVGAFSAAAKPKIFINGQAQTLTAEGTAVFKTTASGTGSHGVDVRIEYAKPDGSIATVNKKLNYTVGVPSGASVFLEKMNVLYVGVENPLTISGGSVGSEKVRVSFSGGAPVNRKSGDSYFIKPTAPGLAKITVVADGKPFEFPMRVKFLPPPTAFVGAKKAVIFLLLS
nr:GldM family protein [Paraflavitalea speifideiaquila]